MNNIENDFIPYQVAFDMELMGFDEPCFAIYGKSENNLFKIHSNKFDTIDKLHFIKSPTYSQAFRWLYQKLDIEKGVMPLDIESQQLLLKELIDKVSSKHLLV